MHTCEIWMRRQPQCPLPLAPWLDPHPLGFKFSLRERKLVVGRASAVESL
jgi:hypothetical protein